MPALHAHGKNEGVSSAQAVVPRANPRTALVLSGGGARGAYEAGVVSQLYAQGERFERHLPGTSIGAINGALLAQRPAADTLRSVWSTIKGAGIIRLVLHKIIII